jgi:DNA-binding beta-propeller fold protein YncE
MPGVVTINTQTKMATLLAVGQFAGNCPSSPIPPFAVGQSGPNGLVIIGKEIWVGDAPHYSTPCNTTTTLLQSSSVQVLDSATGKIKQTILTGGTARADELCYNPFTNTVLVANDEPADNFITFISTETYEVLGTIKFDGSDKKGNNILANGIEQCQYNPRDKKFYLNIPATVTGTLMARMLPSVIGGPA